MTTQEFEETQAATRAARTRYEAARAALAADAGEVAAARSWPPGRPPRGIHEATWQALEQARQALEQARQALEQAEEAERAALLAWRASPEGLAARERLGG